MSEKDDAVFFKKVIEERQKRKDIIAEADSLVRLIDRHYQDKKAAAECIDMNRKEIINEIHNVVKEKDTSKLDTLFERLR